jgi:chemotaxis protein methyltransferase CheR
VSQPLPGASQTRPQVDLEAYGRLADGLRSLLGIDLDQYRPTQMWRRINGFAASHGLAGAGDLVEACAVRPELLGQLREMLTINVSEFFRDPAAWDVLGRHIVERLREGRGFRAWSAGCSVGCEPYSLAMLATELAEGASIRIVASDVDRTALDVGRLGRYDLARTTGLSIARRDRFLVPDGSAWVFRPEIKALIQFRQQDLLAAPSSLRAYDLILCRNVVIYFTDEAKMAVHQRLVGAVRPGGLLFVGSAEAILQPQRLGLRPEGPGIYRRID